ncbi:hypothetical protein DL762_005884 [Monosporascus cannonballus]|uniref:Heterokaryon incompatibility domain-containing protein n=1 Tax=Monosporascus cannonballus TaxID=155416 RepID=A0ABY0H6X1_9PEZI|nr:hypothetical protein DL762_005884 [Monosporascus cannonballus]
MAAPSADRIRLIHQQRRDKRTQLRDESIGGRDLVATALSDSSEILAHRALRDALLGRTCYPPDERAMVKRITNNAIQSHDYLIAYAANPEDGRMPALLDAWKIIICDVRYLEEGANLQDAYDAQLREEELQTAAERAREVVRTEDEKIARRNAKWVIPLLEGLSPEELAQMELQDGGATKAIWKQVSPAPPAWIQQIVDTQQPWGFVFYKTREVEQKYGHKWPETWDAIRENTSWIPYHTGEERPLAYACLVSIHCRGNKSILKKLWTEDWATGPVAGDLAADDALQRHFKDYRESLSSPGILRNTFIVVDAGCIPEDLWECNRPGYEIFWVWAYDADWEPSSTNDTASDGEEYQGRVKVPIYCLNAWFYAARYEGVSLRDMWLKAQNHPAKLWICYSKPLEEWRHESYI